MRRRALFRALGVIVVLLAVAVMAAIAIPGYRHSPQTRNAAGAHSVLKFGLFPAQIEFQRGAFLDADKDGRGEFAPEIAFLAGKTTATMTSLQNFIASPLFNVSQPVLNNGYRFATYTFGDAEKNFVAYAWPDRHENGRRAFAVTNTGVVYERAWTAHDQPLTTFALWGGSEVALGEVEPDPAWKRYQK